MAHRHQAGHCAGGGRLLGTVRRVTRRSDPAPAEPIRTCIGCRGRAPQGDLARLVAEHGRVLVDEHRVLPGRGAWLHPDESCRALADRRRAWGRALRVDGPLDVSAVQEWLAARV
ncbi:MAG: DUF448 domain-containing protein [Actinomycetales bacterium]|nr:DUF448 domain-containing protein [Actinomycetales bacterium]